MACEICTNHKFYGQNKPRLALYPGPYILLFHACSQESWRTKHSPGKSSLLEARCNWTSHSANKHTVLALTSCIKYRASPWLWDHLELTAITKRLRVQVPVCEPNYKPKRCFKHWPRLVREANHKPPNKQHNCGTSWEVKRLNLSF